VSLHSLLHHTKFPTWDISTHITQTPHINRRLSPHDCTTLLTLTVLKTSRTDPAPLTDFQATRDALLRHRYVTAKWAQLHCTKTSAMRLSVKNNPTMVNLICFTTAYCVLVRQGHERNSRSLAYLRTGRSVAGDCQTVESLEETTLQDAPPLVAGTLSCGWATCINTQCYKSYGSAHCHTETGRLRCKVLV